MYWTSNKPFRVVVQTDELMGIWELDSACCIASTPSSDSLLGARHPLLPSAFTHVLISWPHLLSHSVLASQAPLLCLSLPLQGVRTLPRHPLAHPLTSLTAPLCMMAPTAPGTLDCPPVHSAFCQFSSLWNRSHVRSYDILALSLLERQLHESDYFVLSTILFSSTENSTQHIVGMFSCSVMSGSWWPQGL